MSITISDDVLAATRMSADEMRREIAVLFFQKDRLTMAQAARLANMPLLDFQKLLGSQGIGIHYDLDEFQQDLETLKSLRLH